MFAGAGVSVRGWGRRTVVEVSAPELGPWEPLPLDSVVELFTTAPLRWWIAGGHALELYLQQTWRVHEDTDVGVQRSELPAVYELLSHWDVHVAAAGTLTPWRGERLDIDRHQNNLWCRRRPGDPWALDILIGEGSDEHWIYRRDQTVRVPWDTAVLRAATGVPYLAPEIQLLFKSTGPRPKDDVDAVRVIPQLDDRRRQFLAAHLAADHPWQRLLE